MDAVENLYGRPNPKRLGHIHCVAARIIDEVIDPIVKTERIQNVASSHKWDGPIVELEFASIASCSVCGDDATTDRFCSTLKEKRRASTWRRHARVLAREGAR